MFSIWTLMTITAIYIVFLFIVASLGNKAKRLPKSVYSLALGIHCTSWAFFGTTTQATQFGWALVPTYLGVVLVMIFGFSLILRINTICKRYKITSIAEFISIRFEHSQTIAYMVTLICFIGVIPYIALQLDAITTVINLLVINPEQYSQSMSAYVAMVMAGFAIWFGARRMNLLAQNKGLMLTIATQSLIKVTALFVIGMYVVYGVFDGFIDLLSKSLNNAHTKEILEQPSAYWIYASHIILGICSMFCLPRQFHVNFVENRNDEELKQARWLFPSYLIAMSVFVLPIALAGNLLFAASTYSTDSYVLAIPMAMHQTSIVVVAYIGGLAASTSMVIVASLALGNMVSSSVVTPLWLKLKHSNNQANKLSGSQVLRTRQATILVMLFIAYWYHVYVSESTTLVETGTIAISLLSQTMPAIVLGIFWQRANRVGVTLGLIAGVSIIIYGMLYPAILSVSHIALRLDGNEIASVLFIALIANTSIIFVFSYFKQANTQNPYTSPSYDALGFHISYARLFALTDKLLPQQEAKLFKQQLQYVSAEADDIAPQNLVFRAEKTLASYVGSASARILLNAISVDVKKNANDMSELVAQAGKYFQFNKEVLQASITHLPLGVSVIDADLKLVAWNSLYEKFFDYPEQFLKIGKPILQVLEYNASRGLLGEHDHQLEIQKRMSNMLTGRSYKTVRKNLFGKVIEISGHPLPAGGFITCYSDISSYIDIQHALEQAKLELENRVARRTEQLEMAKNQAEKANISKTKFLAATGHDLMQPLNAASLFASMLNERLGQIAGNEENIAGSAIQSSNTELSSNLINSLDQAEDLLSSLIEITKLESDSVKPNLQTFDIGELLQSLANEYRIIASHQGIEFRFVNSSAFVLTDRRLLTRIIQNLLTNAIRYTHSGKILLGVRKRTKQQIEIVVADTGEGIEQAFQQQIFEEFKRVHPNDQHQGLGLGLTIVDRIASLLALKLNLSSTLGKGSAFGVRVPRAPYEKAKTKTIANSIDNNTTTLLANKTVLLIENDLAVSEALTQLLQSWGAEVFVAADQISANHIQATIHLIVADYHLNRGDTGVAVSLSVREQRQQNIPIILSSADKSEGIQALAYEHDMRYLPKPIKTAALKRLIQRVLL